MGKSLFRTRVYTQHRILDFDIENRPLSYWFADATTAEITAIAWGWADEEEVEVRVLYPPPDHEVSMLEMLTDFRMAFDKADMVTGHFIRAHDLPVINSAMLENELDPLGSKLASDTKLDLVKHGKLSVSQQALSDMLEIPRPKIIMPQAKWRDANRLTPAGIEKTIARVVGDVQQHKLMRLELIRRGLLGTPKLWTPNG